MEKKAKSMRGCPVCRGTKSSFLHTMKFALPAGHPLTSGYDVLACTDCGFVFADTQVTQDDYDIFYSKMSKYEDRKTSTGGGDTPEDATRLRRTADTVAKHVADRDARIIDIGCANGGLLKELKKLGYKNLYGVDPSIECVKNTRKIPGVKAYAGTLSNLPKNTGSFDAVILSHVLEHIQDIRKSINAAKTLIKSGGILYAEIPDANRYNLFYAPLPYYFNAEHINHFSTTSLKNLLTSSGFTQISDGTADTPVTPHVRYPIAWVAYRKGGIKEKIAYDAKLVSNIRKYISSALRHQDMKRLSKLNLPRQEIIIWGVGAYASWLLANTPLGEASVSAFTDNNPKYWGMKLKDKPIIPPNTLACRKEPIAVATWLHHPEIVRQIKNNLKLKNKIIIL
ncbi:MAG: class I SAM-dependent methyltransferase [Candidatus Altiarchaeota archaeon]|nr:class I SAM-dependent methyltransferase [Candidatus Altiarchaeota archaeon]